METMTQEDKEMLITDLCARLPYGVKVNVTYSNENASSFRQRVCTEGVNVLNTDIIGLYQRNEIDIKPYLFPLSSMTAEQRREYAHLLTHTSNIDMIQITGESTYDWLNKNMFDWRGLGPRGNALNATGKNIY